MSMAWKCDMCGKYYDTAFVHVEKSKKSRVTPVPLTHEFDAITFTNHIGTDTINRDICPECMKKIFDMFQKEETK